MTKLTALAALLGVLLTATVSAAPTDEDTTTLAPQPPCPYASLFGCFRPIWDYETLGGSDGGSAGGAGDSGGDAGEGDGGEGPGCSY